MAYRTYRSRFGVLAAAVVLMGGLTAGCDGDEQSGARNAAQSEPGASTSGPAPTRTSTASPSPHRTAKHHRRHPRTKHPHATHREHHRRVTRSAEPTPSAARPSHASRHTPRTHRSEKKSTKPAPRHTRTSGGSTATELKVVKLVNARRAAKGCKPLHIDHRLRKAAYLHSRDMGRRHYFSHQSADGRSPWDRIKAQGYTKPSAENIASGQSSPTAVMDAWMHSSGHRTNILNCASKAIGVGVWQGKGGPIWTQDFGYQ